LLSVGREKRLIEGGQTVPHFSEDLREKPIEGGVSGEDGHDAKFPGCGTPERGLAVVWALQRQPPLPVVAVPQAAVYGVGGGDLKAQM
jgi:hypothetical protein